MSLLDYLAKEDWKADASCAELTDSEKRLMRAAEDGTQRTVAVPPDLKAVCWSCPVRLTCLEYAMEWEGKYAASARFGLWGGLTPSERAKLARRRAKKEIGKLSPVKAALLVECQGAECTNRFDPKLSDSGKSRKSREGPKRYCSRACAIRALIAARPRTNIRPCGNCEQMFDSMTTREGKATRSARRFCSAECEADSIRKRHKARRVAVS